nr:MAG TPA: hypothetical protein [Caudoviricetes sp.]
MHVGFIPQRGCSSQRLATLPLFLHLWMKLKQKGGFYNQ